MKQLYYINSSNRLSGTHSNFLYKIQQPPSSTFTHCVVLQASIPKSYYLVQSPNNTFVLDENSIETVVTISVGNYTRSSFVNKVQTSLNSAGSWTYVVDIDDSTNGPETGKLTFTVSGNGGIQPQFIFTGSLYEPLGFESTSTNTFVGDELVSTNVINLLKENTIYIHSDICTNENDNVLQEIFTSEASDYGSITFTNNAPEFYSKKITSLNSIYRFYLTDENGKDLSLNGRNWQMTVCMHEKDKTNEIIRKYIQLKVM